MFGQGLCLQETSALKRSHQGTKLDDYQELLVTGLILEPPQLYTSEMRQHIHDITRVKVLNATICRIHENMVLLGRISDRLQNKDALNYGQDSEQK